MTKPTYIEFIGPAGSGKSTTCEYFVKQLIDEGYRIKSREKSDKLGLLSFCLRNPIYLTRSFFLSSRLSRTFNKNRQKIRKGFFKDLIILRYLLEKNSDMVMYDQGIFFRIIKTQRESADYYSQEKIYGDILKLLFRDVEVNLIFLDITENILAKRFLSREPKGWPLEKKSIKEVEFYFKRNKKIRQKGYNYVKVISNKCVNVKSFNLDVERPLEKNYFIFREKITKL